MGDRLIHGLVDTVIGFLTDTDPHIFTHCLYRTVPAAAVFDYDFIILISLGQDTVQCLIQFFTGV